MAQYKYGTITGVKARPSTLTGKLRAGFKKHSLAYLLLLPALIFLCSLLLLPVINVFIMSLNSVNLLRPEDEHFTGLDNFIQAIQEPLFWSSFKNGLIWTFGSVAGEYIVGMASALLLNQDVKGRAIFRGIIIVPWVVPIVVAGMTWRWMLNPDYGIVNVMLLKMGIIDQSIDWLGNPSTAMLAVIFVNIWRSFPFYTLSFLAGLQAISKDMMEAAELDGANSWQRFKYMTMPNLKLISITLVLLHIIWTFNNFDFIWLLTEAGPLHATETLATITYQLAFQQYHFGKASAMAVMMILFLCLLIVSYFWADRKKINE